MTIRHVFSNLVADATGTLTVWNGATTATVAATDIVRPSDWNSAHELASTISGNTAGQSTVSGTNIVLAGGANITLSANGSTVSIVGGAGGAGNTGYLSAGTTNASLGTVSFANSNGVTFGIDGQTITATVQTNYLTTAMASNRGSDFVQATAAFNGTNASGTIASNAISVSVAAQSVQPVAASAANGSAAFSTLSFSNANGISFSTAAGPAIVASHNGLTSQSNQNVTAANGGFAFQTLSFSNVNGVSFGTSAGSAITASVAAQTNQTLGGYFVGNTTGQSSSSTWDARTLSIDGAGIVSAGWSAGSIRISATQSNQAFSAGAASSTFQTLSFQDSNGLSFSNNAGAIRVSYTRNVASNAIQAVGSASGSGTNTSRFAADDHVHPGVFSMGVSNLGNSAGDTRVDVGRFVLAGGANITLSQATAANALNTISIVAGAGGGETRLTAYAVSNTTQSSSGTIPLSSMQFAGAGIASVGVTNGSVVISVPAGGGGGDGGVFAGVSTDGNTAGSTGTVSTGNFVLVGSNGITLSQSTGAAGSAATVTILGLQRTISGLAIQPFGGMAAGIPFAQSSISLGQNSLYLYPFQLEDQLTVDHVKMPIMVTNSSTNVASIQKGYTYRFGIFTRVNSTQISQLYSTSHTLAASHNSNASWMISIITAIGNSTSYNTLTASSAGLNLSASLHGPREFIMPVSTLLTPGEYWVGLVASTSSVGGAGAILNLSNIAVALQTFNRPGLSTNSTNRAFYNNLGMGLYSATTGAIPASIGMTQVNLAGTQPILFLGAGTV